MTALQKKDPRAAKVAPRPAAKPPTKMHGTVGRVSGRASRQKPVAAVDAFAFAGTASQMVQHMRGGVRAQAVPAIARRLNITQDRLFDLLRLPKSTIKARISKNDILSATEQDRIYRAERALVRATQVFEDEETARGWLSSSIRSLGGDAPLSLLDTEAGFEMVMDTLGRIEFGVYA